MIAGTIRKTSLHLIYDAETEINFITKSDDGNSSNCFLLNLNAHIKNIEEMYNNFENLPEDE